METTIHEASHHMAHSVSDGLHTRYGNYCWACLSSFALAVAGMFMVGIIYPFVDAANWVLVLGTLMFLASVVLGVAGYATVRDRGLRGRTFGFAGAVLSTLLILASLANYALYQGMLNRPFYDLRVSERVVQPY